MAFQKADELQNPPVAASREKFEHSSSRLLCRTARGLEASKSGEGHRLKENMFIMGFEYYVYQRRLD